MVDIKPTESEMEVLRVMWDKEPCTVREVHDELVKTKDVGYTSTLKLMQIMFEKGLVTRDATIRSHLYKSIVTREKAQDMLLDKVKDDVFKGSGFDLVLRALGQHKPSKKEIDIIKQYLDDFEQPKQ